MGVSILRNTAFWGLYWGPPICRIFQSRCYIGIMASKMEATFRGVGFGNVICNNGESNGKELGKMNGNWGYLLAFRDAGFLEVGVPYWRKISCWGFRA